VVHLSGTKVVHPGGLIPIRALRSDVLCYSVYSPTKWATRVLTVEELGRCLETYAIHLPQQKKQRISKVPFGQIPFVFSAPGRLVQVVVKLITQVFLFRQAQEQPDQDTVRQTIPEALVDTPYGLEKDIREDTLEDDAFGRDKAAKDDDVDVAVMDWDKRILKPWVNDGTVTDRMKHFEARFGTDVLAVLRHAALRKWRRNLLWSFRRYMSSTYPLPWYLAPVDQCIRGEWHKDLQAGADCMRRAVGASWWDWDQGSRLFFWRWPTEARTWARDGLPIYHQPDLLPKYRIRQPSEADPGVRRKVHDKLEKFREKSYIQAGSVLSLTPFFTVPKGGGDVRVVFDGTKSQLNAALWAPPFVLPTIVSLLHCVEPGTWMADINIGEMFYNYALDPCIQPYCGVDLAPNFENITTWEVWTRCVMGIRSSPHGCTLMEMIGDEMAKGNAMASLNPFAYDTVRLNLPGSAGYQPNLPWVSKVVLAT
jgi:hypothetical protein